MPDSKINIIFEKDFDRNLDPNQNNSAPTSIPNNKNNKNSNDDSSSSSKTWVIWLIVVILLVILLAIIIIAFYINQNKVHQTPIKNIQNITEINDSGGNISANS